MGIITIQNKACHENILRTIPANIGPEAPPIATAVECEPIAFPRSSEGKTATTIADPTAVDMEIPIAIKTLAKSIISNEGAIAVMTHPTAEIVIGPGHSYTPSEVPPVNYILDTSKARNELNFETTYNTIDMIKDYALTMEKLGIRPRTN